MRYPSTVLYGLRDCSIRGGEVRKLRIYDTLTCIVAREWGGADGTILIFTGVIIEKFCFSTSVESEINVLRRIKELKNKNLAVTLLRYSRSISIGIGWTTDVRNWFQLLTVGIRSFAATYAIGQAEVHPIRRTERCRVLQRVARAYRYVDGSASAFVPKATQLPAGVQCLGFA